MYSENGFTEANPTNTEDKHKMKTLCLPYIQSLSEGIECACKRLDVRAVSNLLRH